MVHITSVIKVFDLIVTDLSILFTNKNVDFLLKSLLYPLLHQELMIAVFNVRPCPLFTVVSKWHPLMTFKCFYSLQTCAASENVKVLKIIDRSSSEKMMTFVLAATCQRDV